MAPTFQNHEHALLNELSQTEAQGNTELHFAVMLRKENTENLLRNKPELAFEKNSMGKYPLLMACENGDFHIVSRLWNLHKSPPSDYHHGCLHAAVQSCVPGMVEKIIALGEDDKHELRKLAFSADSAGDYPIHIAARRGNLDAVKLLLEKFPLGERLPFMVDKQGRNALHIALEHKNEKISCYLLKQKGWEYLALAADHKAQTFIDKAKNLDESALGKFVNALPRILETENPAQKALATKVAKIANKQRDRKRKQEISASFTWLSVTAVLLATISYQGVLSVPGGTSDHGKPNLQDNKHFKGFVLFNTVALTLSVLVVIFLTLDMILGFMSLDRYLVGSKIRMKCLNGVISIGAACIVASFAQALRALFPDNNPVPGYYEILALFLPVFYFVIMVASKFQKLQTFREELGSSIMKLKDTLCCGAPTQQPSPSGGSAFQRPRSSGRAMWGAARRKYRIVAFWAYGGSRRKATIDEGLEIPLTSREE